MENKPFQQPKTVPVGLKGSMVSVKSNGRGIDDMLRRFKKKMKDSGVLEEYKQRQYYIKPSVKKRTKRNAAIQKQKHESKIANDSQV